MSRAVVVELLEVDPMAELVERVARRVVELLDERDQAAATRAPAPRLVDAATLAGILDVSRSTVYEQATKLGAVRVGGALRFDVDRVLAERSGRVSSERSDAAEAPAAHEVRTPRRRRAAQSTDGLLPYPGQEAA